MIRSIKFRQTIHKNGEFSWWHYWGQIDKGHFVSPANPVDPSYQFTGLLDKSKKEIYEGDIVKYTRIIRRTKKHKTFIEEVRYSHASFYPIGIDWNKLKIIGNIVENPELLK